MATHNDDIDDVYSDGVSNETYVKSRKTRSANSEEEGIITTDDVEEPETSNPTKSSSTSSKSSNAKLKHPSYTLMVQEALVVLAPAKTGVSTAKIVDQIRTMYSLTEVNKLYMKKALKTLEEKAIIEHTKGTGASGSFKLTKTFKDTIKKNEAKEKKKEAAAVAKKAKAAESTTTSKTTKSKDDKSKDIKSKDDKSKDDKPKDEKSKAKTVKKSQKTTSEETSKPTTTGKKTKKEEEGKKVTKKPPVSKGKENKDTKKTVTAGNEIKEKKTLNAKVKSVKKSSSTGSILGDRAERDEEQVTEGLDVEISKKRGRKVVK